MFRDMLAFDWHFFTKKKSLYATLILFFGFGILLAAKARFSFANTGKNSPFALTYLLGLMSLLGIFSATLLVAQSLFRERDAHFDQILYATPLVKKHYVASRFFMVFGISVLSFVLLIAGLMLGHYVPGLQKDELIAFRFWNYLQPTLVLVVPNIFLCAALACSVGWLSRNKLLVYVFGLFLYILYMVGAMIAKSPLMAGSVPASAEAMRIAAILDPFGMSAFFEQTRYWSVAQRNTELLALSGNFLLNRLLYGTLSLALLALAYWRFRFRVGMPQISIFKKNIFRKSVSKPSNKTTEHTNPYKPIHAFYADWRAHAQSLWSFVKLDMRSVVGGIPFLLLLLGWAFLLGMEVYSDIGASSRLPERFATTGLMATNILKMFPMIGLLIMLFYGSEIFWRSQSARFAALEHATPVLPAVIFLAKWLVLSLIPLAFIAASVGIGVIFQSIFQTAAIDWSLYLSLFYIVVLPLALCSVLIISFQAVLQNKYVALAVAAVVLLVTNTSLGALVGVQHPLLRFANAFQGTYSEMDGFGAYLQAFHWKMVFWAAVAAILGMSAARAWGRRNRAVFQPLFALRSPFFLSLALCGAVAIGSGAFIFSQTPLHTSDDQTAWKQGYEETYRAYSNVPQPTITNVKTQIDLFPAEHGFDIRGEYTLVNKTAAPLDSVLVYGDKSMQWQMLAIERGTRKSGNSRFGHSTFTFAKPLQPNDSVKMTFAFVYRWSVFEQHDSFNTMLDNGTFSRISRYYPQFGYQSDNEIEDKKERTRRHLGQPTPLHTLTEASTNAAREADSNPYDYGFVQLDAVISTARGQTAIGVGELVKQWQSGERSFFHYATEKPIPFRFAVASARYAIQRVKHNNLVIETYYHPTHGSNIAYMVETVKQTLAYCEQNFGAYPYRTLRFVEISAFTKGFAGTAYPTDFFVNETFGFQRKAQADKNKDIINEMVSHELSHTWWGNATIAPAYQEGSAILTETLAMYTELMVYKNAYGRENITHRVNVHKDIYLSERTFFDEKPLYTSHPSASYLCYDKGQVVMYRLFSLIGEERINRALRNLLAHHAYPLPAPTTLDLLHELYAVSDTSFHASIDALFKQIITHDVALTTVRGESVKDGTNSYNLSIEGTAQQFTEDGKGKKTPQAFSEILHAEIEFDDAPPVRVLLGITNTNGTAQGMVKTTLSFPHKPISVSLDPNGILLDVSTENNERKVNWEDVPSGRKHGLLQSNPSKATNQFLVR